MASNYSDFSGDVSVCGSVLARDCFSNLGSCGSSSYGQGIVSGDAYLKHKYFCSSYCDPVADCQYLP